MKNSSASFLSVILCHVAVIIRHFTDVRCVCSLLLSVTTERGDKCYRCCLIIIWFALPLLCIHCSVKSPDGWSCSAYLTPHLEINILLCRFGVVVGSGLPFPLCLVISNVVPRRPQKQHRYGMCTASAAKRIGLLIIH